MVPGRRLLLSAVATFALSLRKPMLLALKVVYDSMVISLRR